MSEPLPALRPLIARARSAIGAALSERTDNTARVWLPMSAGFESYHRMNCAAMASRPSALPMSIPVAATSAIATAIEVSSVHSPGAQSNGPPPIMSIVTSAFG